MMMLIKRNTNTPMNKGLALMTHADNQSGVLSKSSRESIRGSLGGKPIDVEPLMARTPPS